MFFHHSLSTVKRPPRVQGVACSATLIQPESFIDAVYAFYMTQVCKFIQNNHYQNV